MHSALRVKNELWLLATHNEDISLFLVMGKSPNWREVIVAVRFGVVGAIATSTHIAVLWFLFKTSQLVPFWANSIAFCIAFSVSFWGNYTWTFRSSDNILLSMLRFFAVSLCGFIANTILLMLLLAIEFLPPLWCVLISSSMVPVVSYVANRFWVFKNAG